MNSNELHEHVRKLNQEEKVQHELRRQQALNKIREMRRKIKEEQKEKS